MIMNKLTRTRVLTGAGIGAALFCLPVLAQISPGVQISILPDLTITEVRPVGDYLVDCLKPEPGNTLSVTVTNVGRRAVFAEEAFNVTFELVGEVTVPLGSQQVTGGLAVGATRTVTLRDLAHPPRSTLMVLVNGDRRVSESDFNNNGASIPVGSARSCPNLTISAPTAREGESAAFGFRLSAAAPRDVSIAYTTRDGTARGGSRCDGRVDFVHTSGVVQIPAGQRGPRNVQVVTCRDQVREPDETFTLEVTSTVNVGTHPARTRGTIVDQP
jgi:hypothetical protein